MNLDIAYRERFDEWLESRVTIGPVAAEDVKVIGLVSAAHFMSHFFQIVLPPIFPLLKGAFGVGYAELGIVMTLMYATSGLMQTPAGILVDRLGGTNTVAVVPGHGPAPVGQREDALAARPRQGGGRQGAAGESRAGVPDALHGERDVGVGPEEGEGQQPPADNRRRQARAGPQRSRR